MRILASLLREHPSLLTILRLPLAGVALAGNGEQACDCLAPTLRPGSPDTAGTDQGEDRVRMGEASGHPLRAAVVSWRSVAA